MSKAFRTIALATLLALAVALPAAAKGPPPWAPAHGYRAKVRHIYFPAYNCYFDLQRGVYIYLSGGSWLIGVKLPVSFGVVDFYGAAKVELELDTNTPQKFNAEHLIKYKGKSPAVKAKAKIIPTKPYPGKPGKGKGRGK